MTNVQTTTSPITAAFARARAERRVALIPYVMAGYPDLATGEALAVAFGQAGADLIEIGVPFSDPLADGATVQHASQIALEQGMTLAGALELAGRVSAQAATPLVLMTYYNPIFSYGIEHFCTAAKAAGVAGLIVPDLPAEEADPLLRAARECGIALVFLVAPTSTDARIETVARVAAETGGFIYCVALSGVTGARDRLPEDLAAFIARVRAHTSLPLAVGFGVARPEHVAAIGRIADGAVVASALLNAVDAAPPDQRVATGVAFLRELQSGAHLGATSSP
ncbi:MAG TPA: tryptophan synthase subunit alpha [Ktedonobacterales bacterium]|nr:tryptophan synthase subunit alpha [Ktedonobacterales bacterium]